MGRRTEQEDEERIGDELDGVRREAPEQQRDDLDPKDGGERRDRDHHDGEEAHRPVEQPDELGLVADRRAA